MKRYISFLCLLMMLFSMFLPVQAQAKVASSPILIKSYPSNNTINIKVNSVITLTFKKNIKKGKAFTGINLKTSNGISEKVNLSIKNNVLTIKPVKSMKYNTSYTVLVQAKSINDYSGTPLVKNILLKFRTSSNSKPVQTQPTVQPTTKPSNNDSTKKDLTTHAFYSGFTKYNSDTEGYLKMLDTVSFAWLSLKNDNGNVVLDSKNNSLDFHIPSDYDKPLAYCKENKIPAQIAIFSDGNTAKSIISSADSRKALITKTIDSLKLNMTNGDTFDFNGVVIDFEGFRNDDTKEYFNTFLKELSPALKALNKKLYVAVNVRSYWPGYDYKTILKYSDKVILMAHDYGPSSDLTKQDIEKYINYNSSDPIFTLAPINKVKSAVEDLISCINDKSDMKKIWLQMSFGITQWQFSNISSTNDWNSLPNSAVGKKVNPTYSMLNDRMNNTDGNAANFNYGYIKDMESPYLSYYNTSGKTFNFIIYEDSRSVKAKIDLAKLEGIDGISLWRLGNMPDNIMGTFN